MERLRHMSLIKAFLYLTISFLLIALVLSVLSIIGTGMVLQQYRTTLEIKIGDSILLPPVGSTRTALPFWYNALKLLQLVLPVVFVIAGLLSASLVFYRVKLKKPIEELQAGAEQIMSNNLDFSVKSYSSDEFGKLCDSFEKMRLELLKNNKELWRQMEERKRLNAAFSHDLRNPVAVLKGSVKLLKKEIFSDSSSTQNIKDSVLLIEEYVGRIEKYIEAMSGVQRLEDLQCLPEKLSMKTFIKELAENTRLLTMDSSIKAVVEEQAEKIHKDIWLDKAIAFNVAENLITNAVRYAKSKIQIGIRLDDDNLVLSVWDDGPGFSQAILQKGAEPFLRGDEVNEQGFHFGMGLYVCSMLCEKHDGSLELQNTRNGALATAKFKVSIS